MATHMIDSVTVTRESVFKGAGWLVVSDPDVLSSFPGRLESVMQPSVPADAGETAYALETGWTSLGPTPEDGFTITREAEIGDGIPIDQRQHKWVDVEFVDDAVAVQVAQDQVANAAPLPDSARDPPAGVDEAAADIKSGAIAVIVASQGAHGGDPAT